jgi:putative hydrolase of the HAD superfamily
MDDSRLRAVLFDVDFTLAKPGPDLGPEGYRRLGHRFGLELDTARYPDARAAAVANLKRHPELEHDEEIWIAFTEEIVRRMGGDGGAAHACAVEMTTLWEHSENFELYEDAQPVLAELRGHGLKLALVSNTGRDLDAFVRHHALDVDAAVSSRVHGKTKPDPSIFEAALGLLAVEAPAAAMVGDSVDDDVEGARALGMRAFLLDREGRHPDRSGVLRGLHELPAALGLRTRLDGRRRSL